MGGRSSSSGMTPRLPPQLVEPICDRHQRSRRGLISSGESQAGTSTASTAPAAGEWIRSSRTARAPASERVFNWSFSYVEHSSPTSCAKGRPCRFHAPAPRETVRQRESPLPATAAPARIISIERAGAVFLSRYPQAPKALAGQGRYGEAVTLERETLDIKRCVLGHKHPRTARSTYGIGGILARKGDRDEALSLLREAVDDGLPPNIDLAQRTRSTVAVNQPHP